MYKVGDMLRCKIDNPFVSIQFYKDIEYEVLYISEYLTKVSNNKNNYFFFVNDSIFSYFYTEKELRKLKLERIQNV